MFTDLATNVLLLGTSSSPKKNGVVAPTPLPAPSFIVIVHTDWSCNIKVYELSDTLAVVAVTILSGYCIPPSASNIIDGTEEFITGILLVFLGRVMSLYLIT